MLQRTTGTDFNVPKIEMLFCSVWAIRVDICVTEVSALTQQLLQLGILTFKSNNIDGFAIFFATTFL